MDKQQIYNSDYYKVRAYEIDNLRSHFDILAQAIKTHLKPTMALDVGCARGYFVKAMRELGIEAFGMDLSSYALDNCAVGMGRYLRQGDADLALPYQSNVFDLVTCMECIEHLEMPEMAVGEMSRILKVGGYALIATPKMTLWRRLYNAIIGQAEVHPGEFSKKAWCALFKDKGLEYAGDFVELWGIRKKLHTLTVDRTYKMIPCHPIGQFLCKFGKVGGCLRVHLNILVWQSEFMLFRKI